MRRAVVTGGANGIGAAVVAKFRENGMKVYVSDLTDCADLRMDVSRSADYEQHRSVLDATDILVNCAGIVGPNAPLWEVDESEWRRTLDVDLTGPYLMCRAVVPGMRRRGWGRIVNVASVAGKEGNPNLAAYSAAKAGLIAMTKSLGKELARDGVLVNAVAPAVIESPMNAETDPGVLEYMISRIPMGRMGSPNEVANMVAWLCSDECSFSTAATFDLSGGRLTY